MLSGNCKTFLTIFFGWFLNTLFQDELQNFGKKIFAKWGCSQACIDSVVSKSSEIVATGLPTILLTVLIIALAISAGLLVYEKIRSKEAK